MSATTKPLVLIASVTGRTGGSIAESLLESGSFRVATVVRPSSLSKPSVQRFASQGVEIRRGDITESDPSALDALVKDVDILILSVLAMVDQKPIILAAQRAGVKRVVPSEFGPPLTKGVVSMVDIKLELREFIKEHGIPYTFIEIGWWTHQLFPYPHGYKTNSFEGFQNLFRGDGKATILCTPLEAIGEFVTRIIEDDRTLNQTVITWDYEVVFEDVWKAAERASGESFDNYTRQSYEEIIKLSESDDPFLRLLGQYPNSLYVRQDCTLANAKRLGDLDARELYPDYTPVPFEERVRAFYQDPFRIRGVDLSSFGESEGAKEYIESVEKSQ